MLSLRSYCFLDRAGSETAVAHESGLRSAGQARAGTGWTGAGRGSPCLLAFLSTRRSICVESVLPLLSLLTYVAIVLGAGPAVALTFLLARWVDFERALTVVVGLPVLGAVLGALVLGGPVAGLVVAGTALTLVIVPLLVGVALVSTRADGDTTVALRRVALAWPVALLVSAAIFFLPGGVTRYNVTFLDWLVGLLAIGFVVAVVLLGPGIIGVLSFRRRGTR